MARLTVAQQVVRVAGASQQQRTSHAPKVVTVVLRSDTLVTTLHNALSPAEKTQARTWPARSRGRSFATSFPPTLPKGTGEGTSNGNGPDAVEPPDKGG